MLLFISESQLANKPWKVSIHHMLLFIFFISIAQLQQTFRFQYITCYSLSADRAEIKRYKIMFQYITCYSLSTVDSNLCAVSSRFNTSHVTLYLWQQKQVHLWNSFNTSHVTLYHWPIFPGTHYSLVSIHHMLLFIYEHIVGGGENDVVSIHHMLLFINMELSNLRPAEVSIHHMLLFI